MEIFYDPATQNAWREYLLRLHKVMERHKNARFAYLTWEDFFFYWIMGVPIEWRLKLGKDMGYQDFLKDTPLEQINHLYGETFASHADIPIPLYNTPSAGLYYAFHDHLWLKLLAMSREAFPDMNFEIRTDCDPTGGGPLFCHDQTFDLGGEGITVVYYSPGWGAPNKGDLATGEEAARLFEAMLETVRQKTDNPIFVDQFNFVDNTMEFRRNTSIDPAELPDFLARSAEIIKSRTMGYGLWTMQDKPRSVLTNGSFELEDRHWTIEGGRIVDGPAGGRSLFLETGGEAGHELAMTGGMRGVSDEEAHNHSMILRLFGANQGADTARFLVRVFDEKGKQLYGSIGSLLAGEEKIVEFKGIPGSIFGKLSISCMEGSARFDQALLYAFEQKNGVYDLNGTPRPFRDALLKLNAALTWEAVPAEPVAEHVPKL